MVSTAQHTHKFVSASLALTHTPPCIAGIPTPYPNYFIVPPLARRIHDSLLEIEASHLFLKVIHNACSGKAPLQVRASPAAPQQRTSSPSPSPPRRHPDKLLGVHCTASPVHCAPSDHPKTSRRQQGAYAGGAQAEARRLARGARVLYVAAAAAAL